MKLRKPKPEQTNLNKLVTCSLGLLGLRGGFRIRQPIFIRLQDPFRSADDGERRNAFHAGMVVIAVLQPAQITRRARQIGVQNRMRAAVWPDPHWIGWT